MPAIQPASSRAVSRLAAGLSPRLGVLAGRTPAGGRIPEERLCRMLAEIGERTGEPVIVFGPEGAASSVTSRTVTGWMLCGGRWVETAAPVPPVVFDRRFPRTPSERAAGAAAVRALHAAGAALLGGVMPGKREVAEALSGSPTLAPLLPPTARWRPGRTNEWLNRYPEGLFLKPSAGMQGRGTIAVRGTTSEYRLDIRSSRNVPVSVRASAASLDSVIARVARGRAYIVQPLLRLTTQAGAPYDIRIFVQKEGSGRWQIAGAAARIGQPGGATSNLHGGGEARHAQTFLAGMFGPMAASRILRRARRAALLTARACERSFGRLAELGIDFGVEPDGRIWLLEVNARPGRSILRLNSGEAERLAAERTLAYGRRVRAAYGLERTDE